MFLRNGWYLAAFDDEIVERPLARTLLGEPLVIFRQSDGRIAVLEDRCCHRAAPLSLGEVTDEGLMCGYHGMVFEGGGRCVRIPGQASIPERARVRSYPVEMRGELAWVWMGDPAKCDPEAIPVFPQLPHAADWAQAHAMIHVKGGYTLLLDNLMDLTHLPYLHKGSIGGDPNDHVSADTQIEEGESGVRFRRLIADTPPPPRYIEAYGFKGRIDRWEEFEFVVPAAILQSSGATDAGLGVIDKGLRDGPHVGIVLHALTPETETTTHYFFTVAHRTQARADETIAALKRVFAEDVAMIEAQQERLSQAEGILIDIRGDAARHRMERVLSRRIETENDDKAVVAVGGPQDKVWS